MPSILRASIIYKTLMSNWRRFLRASPSLRSSASSPGTRSGTYLAPRKQWGPLGRLLRPPKAMGQWVLWTVHVRCFGLAQQPPSLLGQSAGGGSKDRCTRRGGSSVSTVQRTRTLLHRAGEPPPARRSLGSQRVPTTRSQSSLRNREVPSEG